MPRDALICASPTQFFGGHKSSASRVPSINHGSNVRAILEVLVRLWSRCRRDPSPGLLRPPYLRHAGTCRVACHKQEGQPAGRPLCCILSVLLEGHVHEVLILRRHRPGSLLCVRPRCLEEPPAFHSSVSTPPGLQRRITPLPGLHDRSSAFFQPLFGSLLRHPLGQHNRAGMLPRYYTRDAPSRPCLAFDHLCRDTTPLQRLAAAHLERHHLLRLELAKPCVTQTI